MNYVTGLRCVKCGREFSPEEVEYTCEQCGIDGILDVHYDYGAAAPNLTPEALAGNSDFSIWRYRAVLPIDARAHIPTLQVGWTPVYDVPRLADHLGLDSIFIKDDGRNPTGAFKDRASAVGVAKALELGRSDITCASTGNAASSLAGFCANVGLSSYIFVPETAPQAKVSQLQVFGATVFQVRGSYDQAYYLCMEAAEKWGWYNRNCAVNPYLVEGKKTAGWEIAEQFDWNPPDVVVFAVGDGCTISGAWKGLVEAHALGLITRLPRMIGVQADGSDPIVRAFQSGEVLQGVPAETLADSIAVGQPRNWRKALRAVRESGGTLLSVSDDEIVECMAILGRHSGVFGEPAGATGLAGIRRLVSSGKLGLGERVLLVVTGNGLKDPTSATRATRKPYMVDPTLDSVSEVKEQLRETA